MTANRTSIAPPQMTSSGPQSFSLPWASTSRFSRRYAARKTISAIFPSSPGWIWSEPTWIQSREPLIVSPMTGSARQEEQAERRDPEDVLVALEDAVVVPQPEERRGEDADADHDPEPLAERVARAEPVDLRHADRRQERRHRQQVRVGERHGHARDDVRDEIEAEEEGGVAERAGRDLRLERDVDRGEADRRQQADREQCGELAVAEGHRVSPQTRSAAATATTTHADQDEPDAPRVGSGLGGCGLDAGFGRGLGGRRSPRTRGSPRRARPPRR